MDFGLFIILSLIVLIAVGADRFIDLRREKFLQEVSNKFNLEYKANPEKYFLSEINLMQSFKSSLFDYSKTVSVRGVLEGQYRDHAFSIFSTAFYFKNNFFIRRFTVGSSEFSETRFPHILLRSKRMSLYQDNDLTNTKITVADEYLDDFDLYCPQNYEIEILQIFTKELLDSVRDVSKDFSIEFGGNRFYVYFDKDIQKKGKEEGIRKMIQIIQTIIDKTDGLLLRLKDDFEVLDAYYKK